MTSLPALTASAMCRIVFASCLETKAATRTAGKSLALSGAPVTEAKTPPGFTLPMSCPAVAPRTVLATASTGESPFRAPVIVERRDLIGAEALRAAASLASSAPPR